MAKLFKDVLLPVAGGVGGFLLGGPAGAALGAGLGSSLGGGNTKRNLTWGALGGAGGLAYGGLGGLGGASVGGSSSGLGALLPGTSQGGGAATTSSIPSWLRYAQLGNMGMNMLGGGGQQQPMFGPGVNAQPQGNNPNPFAGWPQMNPYGPNYGRY